MKTDILIVGCGVSGLYCALNLPQNKKITLITKSKSDESNSFLAQGGICVLRSDDDYDSFFEDTLKAGHYENDRNSVDIMISSSREVIDDLISFGVDFKKGTDGYQYTKEGAHSNPRILFHKDETGREITSHLLATAQKRENIRLIENCTMVDLICANNSCCGVIIRQNDHKYSYITADYTILATGGIGGLFQHSTNFSHLTGDSLALSVKHGITLKNIDYIQIHPTTLYTERRERSFLISESVRGEGAILLNSDGERFVDELLPRDVVTKAIKKEMAKTDSKCVWLSLKAIPKEEIISHFPNIYNRCLEEGFDITKEPIPIVPAQHYFMGGIAVDYNSKTSMERLYAVGETACNGVHGKNRLASNSLLESLVFAKRAAKEICNTYSSVNHPSDVSVNPLKYRDIEQKYKEIVLAEIEKEKNKNG